MRDLDIRGAGNLLGAEQSGFINDLGYELYHKMLDEAVKELKESEFKDLFGLNAENIKPLVPDCQIETDLAVLIPDFYVKNISERLSLYTRLDSLQTEEQLVAFEQEVHDRFGPLPHEVRSLVQMARVRAQAEQLYIEKLTLKNSTLKAYFVTQGNEAFFQSNGFDKILHFVQQNPRRCSMKDIKGKLLVTVNDVKEVSDLQQLVATWV